jgi:hypothetical protein
MKAKSKMNEEICECGHKFREHDRNIGGCKAKAKNGRNTCECIEFKCKKNLINFIIEITKNETLKEIINSLKDLKSDIEGDSK